MHCYSSLYPQQSFLLFVPNLGLATEIDDRYSHQGVAVSQFKSYGCVSNELKAPQAGGLGG